MLCPSDEGGYNRPMTRKFYFEDDEASEIPQLFLAAYENTHNIVFTKGSGNIAALVERELEHSDVEVIAFLDLVPNNRLLRNAYNDLSALSKMYEYRCIALPIVCSEYYYLRSLQGSTVIRDSLKGFEYLDKVEFYKQPFLSKHKKSSYFSFERYCKLLCDDYLHPCARIRRKGSNANHRYCTSNCLCDTAFDICAPQTLENKSKKLLTQYPATPYCSLHACTCRASTEDVWNLHRQLVDEYNVWESKISTTEVPKLEYIKNVTQ